MLYYSTNRHTSPVSLEEAVAKGLADDRGLFMPERIPTLPAEFFDRIDTLSFQEIARTVADAFFGQDVEANALHRIVDDTLAFDVPLVHVCDNIYSLELYHGPTLAFKDVGARFMSRLLAYFIRQRGQQRPVHVLVATSGDTGSAVANGFLGVEGIHVHVLYPKGLVSPIQECQFTTLGRNITAIEVDGTFDDCQRMVKAAFLDPELHHRLCLTSANSINVARFLPQSFYYFHAYAQLKRLSPRQAGNLVVCVPSGNFGNLTAGLFACRMGLPVKRFIAANNRNDVFLEYLRTGTYRPRPSVPTIANAMDVGDPSNFARIRMRPSAPTSAEHAIPTNRLPMPSAPASTPPAICSTRTGRAATRRWQTALLPAKRAFSWKRRIPPNSATPCSASLAAPCPSPRACKPSCKAPSKACPCETTSRN